MTAAGIIQQIFWKACPLLTADANIFCFPEISERKRQCTPDSKMPPGIIVYSWMRICSILSRTFYRIIRKTCKLDMGDGKGDFRMMNRAMADSVLELKEYNRYMKGIFSFVGFETKWIPFHNVERTAGETKWSLHALFRYAVDGILSFSSAPITMAWSAGAFMTVAAAAVTIWGIAGGNGLTGITLLVSLILLLNGIQMFFISILGQYAAKDYMENKNRPIYIVKKRSGL